MRREVHPHLGPETEDYLLYLGTSRAFETEYDMTFHDLDRALWVIDSNN